VSSCGGGVGEEGVADAAPAGSGLVEVADDEGGFGVAGVFGGAVSFSSPVGSCFAECFEGGGLLAGISVAPRSSKLAPGHAPNRT
jgi:hypothetical protein